MSKIRFGRMLEIANCNEELLRRAVERLAELLGGRVVTQVRDFYGKRQQVSIGLETDEVHKGIHRGIGFEIKDGRIVSVGDDFGYEKAYANIQRLLCQTYNTLSMEQKLKQKGYQVQTQIKVVGGALGKVQAQIQGVRW